QSCVLLYRSDYGLGDVMKVWPPSKQRRIPLSSRPRWRRPARATSDLSDWVLTEEKRLVETRFAGDWTSYAAWRDRLWFELQESMRRPDSATRPTEDEKYVV